ncbi:MAG: family 78 glycoside hydrolase catalytic domain [Eubacteriales bacterium]
MENGIFTGKWICDPRFSARTPLNVFHREHEKPELGEHPDELRNVHCLFRRTFALQKKPGRYLLRVSADDYAKLYVNGAFVSQGPTPGYPQSYYYNEFDITDRLHDGANTILAHVYYQGLINRVWVSGDLRMGLIADLIAPDGSVLLSTDASWEYAPLNRYTGMRKTGYDTQYLEDYDSRIPDAPFAPAAVRLYDDIRFDPTPAAPLDISERLPVHTEKLPGGGIFCDFGQEITGTLKISAAGKSGTVLRILCGEETDDSDVRVRYNMRCNCLYEDTWTLADGADTFEQFDYKAFRYAAIIPTAGEAEIGGVCAVVRHAAFDDDACTLHADDKVLEAVFNICKQGVKYGTQEIYMDCPSREKGQYAGDMTVTSGSQLWLSGNPAMLEKAIREQARSAFIDEGLMAVTPGSLMQEIADYSLQFPLLLLRHYRFTHNKAFLAEMLPVAERMYAYFAKYAREDGLLDGVTGKWNLVDWPQNLRDDYDFALTKPIGPGVHNVINAFYVGCTLNIEEIKDILGIPHDAAGRALAEAFNRVFLDPETGLYVDAEGSRHSSLHANMLAPFYGFVPAGYEKTVGDYLIRRGFVCGVYMTYFMLRGLCRLGRQEDVYRMITSQDENSWYNMVREGGTTCFEAWGKDKKWNTSLCHPWASTPIVVLIEDILSVTPDGEIGEAHLPAGVGRIEMQVPTNRGFVTVRAEA